MKKIFVIHGWTYTLAAWEQCVAELKAHGIDPVLLKVPGLTEHSAAVWDLDKYIAWLDEQLKGEKDITLVGHSNGGRIAIAYTTRYKNRIARLVLIDAAGIVHNELPLRVKRALFGTIARAGKKVFKSQILRKTLYRLIGAKDYERAPQNMRDTMRNLITVDLEPKLKEIDIPTLIIWGDEDKETPLNDAYTMDKQIKDSKLIVIYGTGHSPHKTHPKEVADAITHFVA